MITNLKQSLIDFMTDHKLSPDEVQCVNFFSQVQQEICHCDFIDFIELAEDINFEDYDPLIKHREVISQSIAIIAETWFISRSRDVDSFWQLNVLPVIGEYEDIEEEDIITDTDRIDDEMIELCYGVSNNSDYVRDNLVIDNERYIIENKDGIERVVDDKGRVAVILACNPNGRYWTVPSTTVKDPQILYYPELVKIVIEYRASNPIKGYQLEDGNIAEVFDIDELSVKYNLDFGPLGNQHFNNLQVIWVPKDTDYIIDFSGAASHDDLRHEVIYPVDSVNIVRA